MPRNPKFVAQQRLLDAVKNRDRAKKAAKKAQDDLYGAMIRAVETGTTRAEVAKICGTTASRISIVPGMPAGPNVHKKDLVD